MGAPQISLDCKGALSWSTQSGKTRGRLDESWCQQKRKFHREVRGDGAWRRGACRLREAWETSHYTAYTSSSDCVWPLVLQGWIPIPMPLHICFLLSKSPFLPEFLQNPVRQSSH